MYVYKASFTKNNKFAKNKCFFSFLNRESNPGPWDYEVQMLEMKSNFHDWSIIYLFTYTTSRCSVHYRLVLYGVFGNYMSLILHILWQIYFWKNKFQISAKKLILIFEKLQIFGQIFDWKIANFWQNFWKNKFQISAKNKFFEKLQIFGQIFGKINFKFLPKFSKKQKVKFFKFKIVKFLKNCKFWSKIDIFSKILPNLHEKFNFFE